MELAAHLRRFPAGPDDLAFTNREHKPLNRNHFNGYGWRPALVAAGVEPGPGNGIHALRHFYASAEYLGQSDPGSPCGSYAHLFPSSEHRARVVIDRLFGTGHYAGRVAAPAYDDRADRQRR